MDGKTADGYPSDESLGRAFRETMIPGAGYDQTLVFVRAVIASARKFDSAALRGQGEQQAVAVSVEQRGVLQRLANRMRLLAREGGVWVFDIGEREKIAEALDCILTTPPAPQQGEAVAYRDSVLSSARFRAICYALVGIIEGIENKDRRWAANGERLKDTPEWVAFYLAVSAMRNGTTPPAPSVAGLRELVAMWRSRADSDQQLANEKRDKGDLDSAALRLGYATQGRECADELEAALGGEG